MMKKKIKKISIVFVLSVVLLSCFVFPCSAWEPPPDFQGINGTGYNVAQMGYATYTKDGVTQIAWSFYEFRIPNGTTFNFEYKYFVDPYVLGLWLSEYINQNNALPESSSLAANFKSSLTVYGSSWSANLLDEEIDRVYVSALPMALYSEQYGYDRGYEEGKKLSYNQGYTDGLNESDIAENTILTIFSAPTYILGTIFDFELFGINLYTLICFFLTLTVIAFILKRVL